MISPSPKYFYPAVNGANVNVIVFMPVIMLSLIMSIATFDLKIWRSIFVVIFLCSAGWFGAASLQPLKPKKIYVVVPTTIRRNDGVSSQVITFKGEDDGSEVFVNLNEKFEGFIPENMEVEVTEYWKYYYLGVSYYGTISCKPIFKLRAKAGEKHHE